MSKDAGENGLTDFETFSSTYDVFQIFANWRFFLYSYHTTFLLLLNNRSKNKRQTTS